jgi:hypothetical protein
MADTAYDIPIEVLKETHDMYEEWRRQRSAHLFDLVAAVPEKQVEALTVVLKLEGMHTSMCDAFNAIWMSAVQSAYLAGLAKREALPENDSTTQAVDLAEIELTKVPNTWH